MNQEKFTFSVGDETLSALTRGDQPRLLFIHGASSRKETYGWLADEMANYGIPSFSFDFSGHGESTGAMAASSLGKRLKEARKAMEYVHEPYAVFGSSMGAYTAVQITKEFPVSTLILFNPAMYSRKAQPAHFTQEFSQIIRKPHSWRDSDAFDILEHFEGRLLIVIGEQDEVIPKEIITLLDTHSSKVQKKEIIWLPNCTHNLHQCFIENPEAKERVVTTMVSMMKADSE